MKRLGFSVIIFAFIFSAGCQTAQTVAPASWDKKVSIIIDNITQPTGYVFATANGWIADEFPIVVKNVFGVTMFEVSSIVQYQDKSGGIIKGKALALLESRPIEFNITVEIKKNKCRISFENMTIHYPETPNIITNMALSAEKLEYDDFVNFKKFADEKILTFKSRLEKSKDDNW